MATAPSPVPTAYSCHVEICKTDRDRTVPRPDTYVYTIWLVSGARIHVLSLSYLGDCARLVIFRDFATRGAAMAKPADLISDNIEVIPVVVLSQTFPARPSSIPDIRDFVRRCLAQSPLSEDDNRAVGETVAQALLEAAGPAGAIKVSLHPPQIHVAVDGGAV